MPWFKRREYKNRAVEYPGRVKLVQIEGNTYDVLRAEGNVTTEGDRLDASTLDDLERRIEEGQKEMSDGYAAAIENANEAAENASTKAGEAKAAADNANTKADKAESAAENANANAGAVKEAVKEAENLVATVQNKLDKGEFKGEKGTPGGTDELGVFVFKSTICSIDSQTCTYVLQGSIAHIECNLTITPKDGAASVLIDGLPFTPKNVVAGCCGKCTADVPVRIYSLMSAMPLLSITSLDGSPLKAAGGSFDITFVANYEVKDTTTQYGVRFDGGANPGTRLYNAYGLTAEVGTDSTRATNHFDTVYPWSARRRCCGQFDDKGDFIVNAYEGDAGYTTNGSNGEVWVEHSLFYYKHTAGEEGEVVISATHLDGFQPAPIFVRADGTLKQKAYTAAYPMALVDGKATSRAGVHPEACSLNDAMAAARQLGANYTATTMAEWYTECLYMWVEFATRDLQSVMRGATTLPYEGTYTAVVAEKSTNRIIVKSNISQTYVVGQTICIGTAVGGTQIAAKRIVTAIDDYDADNKSIVFDGDPVNITVGNVVWSSPWLNGTCDRVLSSSGSPVNNTKGKYNCIYRGKEAPYGNVSDWIADVLIKKGQTDAEAYYLPDPTKYADGVITDDYIKLDCLVPITTGYIRGMGQDNRYPHVQLPAVIGASAATYYSDMYYYPLYPICATAVGGGFNIGSNAGPCCFSCNAAPKVMGVSRGARLSYHN